MSEKPTPTPEGELIQSALARAGMSARAAAKSAGISEGRWRQIVNGYQVVTKGTYVPVTDAPAATVAAMAKAVGLTPAQLADVGRDDAAQHLEELGVSDAQPAPEPRYDGERVGPDDLLHTDERLLWRDEARGRRYWLADKDDSSVNVEYLFEPGETPEQVVHDLRDLLAPYRVAVEQMERRRARR